MYFCQLIKRSMVPTNSVFLLLQWKILEAVTGLNKDNNKKYESAYFCTIYNFIIFFHRYAFPYCHLEHERFC